MTSEEKVKEILRQCETTLAEQPKQLVNGEVTDLSCIISIEAYNNYLKGAQSFAGQIKSICEHPEPVSWETEELKRIFSDREW